MYFMIFIRQLSSLIYFIFSKVFLLVIFPSKERENTKFLVLSFLTTNFGNHVHPVIRNKNIRMKLFCFLIKARFWSQKIENDCSGIKYLKSISSRFVELSRKWIGKQTNTLVDPSWFDLAMSRFLFSLAASVFRHVSFEVDKNAN